MSSKKWLQIWISTLILIPLLALFNYVVDPMGYNHQFTLPFNKIKNRVDERIMKFNLMRDPSYNTYIFGSSINTILDPTLIDRIMLNQTKAINLAFSSATIDEIELYVNYLLETREVKAVFIPIDLFAFSSDFVSNGILPTELTSTSQEKRYKEYFSLDMIKASYRTVLGNIQAAQHSNPEEINYIAKGMRYYNKYFDAVKRGNLDQFISENVTHAVPHWHGSSISEERIRIFKRMYYTLLRNDVEVYIYTNPVTYQQIQKDSIFLNLLDLLERLLSGTSMQIYDFNNMNAVNFDNTYFFDHFHYNYDAGNCIIEKILTGKSKCSSNFGYIITEQNIRPYKALITKKYLDLIQSK